MLLCTNGVGGVELLVRMACLLSLRHEHFEWQVANCCGICGCCERPPGCTWYAFFKQCGKCCQLLLSCRAHRCHLLRAQVGPEDVVVDVACNNQAKGQMHCQIGCKTACIKVGKRG
jgi:hypothetical protein